jgi:transposase
MQIVYRRCGGMDVHKKTVVMTLLLIDEETGEERRKRRTFGTTTRCLRELAGWLREWKVEAVAMESTGVFWKPVWNVLEEDAAECKLLLVNARHFKQVPGRKTDQKDADWLAELLQHGLVKGSFVPPKATRELRDLTRGRATLMEDHTAVANRLQKLLEESNIKLSSVASNALGVSGRRILKELAQGNRDAAEMAELALRRLREKIPQLQEALEGRMSPHQQQMLNDYLKQLEFLEKQVEALDRRIEEHLTVTGQMRQVELLDTIPGVNVVVAAAMVAELGVDMNQFPDAAHVCSWAGMCPGNHISAGKRYSGRTNKGNVWLRRVLCQAAWAAGKSKKTYLGEQYRRWKAHRGKKRGIVALGHQILEIAYTMLKADVPYREWKPAKPPVEKSVQKSKKARERNWQGDIDRSIQTLRALGYNVTLPAEAPRS